MRDQSSNNNTLRSASEVGYSKNTLRSRNFNANPHKKNHAIFDWLNFNDSFHPSSINHLSALSPLPNKQDFGEDGKFGLDSLEVLSNHKEVLLSSIDSKFNIYSNLQVPSLKSPRENQVDFRGAATSRFEGSDNSGVIGSRNEGLNHSKCNKNKEKLIYMTNKVSFLKKKLALVDLKINELKEDIDINCRTQNKFLAQYKNNKENISNLNNQTEILLEEKSHLKKQLSKFYAILIKNERQKPRKLQRCEEELEKNTELRKELSTLQRDFENKLKKRSANLKIRTEEQMKIEVKNLSIRYTNNQELIRKDMEDYITNLKNRNRELKAGKNTFFR